MNKYIFIIYVALITAISIAGKNIQKTTKKQQDEPLKRILRNSNTGTAKSKDNDFTPAEIKAIQQLVQLKTAYLPLNLQNIKGKQ